MIQNRPIGPLENIAFVTSSVQCTEEESMAMFVRFVVVSVAVVVLSATSVPRTEAVETAPTSESTVHRTLAAGPDKPQHII